jgi:hypothetical protein
MQRSASLFVALSLALIAACGGGNTPAQNPAPTPAPTATASAPVASSSTAAAGSSTAPPGPTAALPASMKLVSATTMEAELRAVGLDPKNLPPLDKLNTAQNTLLMKTFTKSLGWTCKDCHGTGKFEAKTPNKNVTIHMWNEYVRNSSHAAGTLYCDSCHQGKAHFLDRTDKKGLAAWMDQEYTKKMKHDGKDMKCSSCHGEPFNPSIITAWEK